MEESKRKKDRAAMMLHSHLVVWPEGRGYGRAGQGEGNREGRVPTQETSRTYTRPDCWNRRLQVCAKARVAKQRA